MSYGKVLKINSDLTTPLNVTLGKKADVAGATASTTLFSWIKSIYANLTTVTNNTNTINSNTARGAVKSVQRGYTRSNNNSALTISINYVDMSKCIVNLSGNYTYSTEGYVWSAILMSTTNTSIVVGNSFNPTATTGTIPVYFSWQVIEFY